MKVHTLPYKLISLKMRMVKRFAIALYICIPMKICIFRSRRFSLLLPKIFSNPGQICIAQRLFTSIRCMNVVCYKSYLFNFNKFGKLPAHRTTPFPPTHCLSLALYNPGKKIGTIYHVRSDLPPSKKHSSNCNR